MEERGKNRRNYSGHLTNAEKDVLDEYILEIKSGEAIIPLTEEHHRVKYEKMYGKNSALNLLKANVDYLVIYGEFDSEQYEKLRQLLM